MLVQYLCSLLVCFQSIMVMADNYLMLLETDPACDKSQQRNNFMRTVVDDVILHEQLLLTWPHPPGGMFRANLSESNNRLYLRACSGLLVRPSGRYVQRTLPKGVVSFWLLRAVITLQCPPMGIQSNASYIHLDQWIETNTLGVFAESTDSLPIHNDHDSIRPIIYSPQPDKSFRLDCSQSKNSVATYQLTGYVRRVRLFWRLSGALQPTRFVSARPVEQYRTESANPDDDDPQASAKNITVLPYPTEQNPVYQLLHPDFGIRIRLTSRMLFEGNFSQERKRALCEFFSGFWCPSSRPVNATEMVQSEDLEACIQASMRCDKLPDCNPSSNITDLSADEIDCDPSSFNHSIERQEKMSNSSQADRWTSKVPWIVLAPVPLVLVCALVRICSQKRHLEVADERDWNRWQNASGCTNVASLVDGAGAAENVNKRMKLTKTFWTGKYHRRGPQYGPIRTLSSVPEVDERDLDAHSSLNISEDMDCVHSDVDHLDRLEGSGDVPVSSAIGDSSGPLSSNGVHFSDKRRRLIKSQSLIPLPSRGGGTLVIDSFLYDVENRRRKRSHITEDVASSNNRRRFLCWSILKTAGSSSTSSSRSSSSSSSCSNCRPVDVPTVLRSRSCNDLTNLWPSEFTNVTELQVLSSKNDVADKFDGQTDVQLQAEKRTSPPDESLTNPSWFYPALQGSGNRPPPFVTRTRLLETSYGSIPPKTSESAHIVTTIAQLTNPDQSSERQSTDLLDLMIEHPLESNDLRASQASSEKCADDLHCYGESESLHTDPLDTRSGSRDRLLLFHRSQSPPRNSE